MQKQLGYAKSIPSVSSPLLNGNVNIYKNDCTEGVLGNAKNEGLSFCPQILTFTKCLKERKQIP